LQPDGLMGCWGVGVLVVYPSEFTPPVATATRGTRSLRITTNWL